jgi:hypothetical protein
MNFASIIIPTDIRVSTTLAGPAKNIKATPKPTIRLNLQASAEIKHVQRRKKAIRAA